MVVATPEQTARLATLEDARSTARKQLDAVAPQLDLAQQQWELDVVAYGVTLPELAKDSQATAVEKKTAAQVMATLKKDPARRKGPEKLALQTYFRSNATKLFAAERQGLAGADREFKAFYDSLPKCLVS